MSALKCLENKENAINSSPKILPSAACYGLVELTKHLLQEGNYEYICLGMFSTDPLGKAFWKLRQGSSGPYFIDAQQVAEKLRNKKTKLQITLDHEMADSSLSLKYISHTASPWPTSSSVTSVKLQVLYNGKKSVRKSSNYLNNCVLLYILFIIKHSKYNFLMLSIPLAGK